MLELVEVCVEAGVFSSEFDVLVDEPPRIPFQLLHPSPLPALHVHHQLSMDGTFPGVLKLLLQELYLFGVGVFGLGDLALAGIEFVLGGGGDTESCFSRCLILMRSFWFLSRRAS